MRKTDSGGANGPTYAQSVRSWHSAPDREAQVDPRGRPLLVLYSINTGDREEFEAADEHGGFCASDLDRAAYLLRDRSNGDEHPIEPRTLDLLYQVQTHFGAREIRFVSAYRSPRGHMSNHGRGRAVDFVVPGVRDETVAVFARQLGFVGVGTYPHSGFVHLDVRDRSYFWVDSSGPGRQNRERPVLGNVAIRSDEQALARGERPIPPVMKADVDAALRSLLTQAAAESADIDVGNESDEPVSR